MTETTAQSQAEALIAASKTRLSQVNLLDLFAVDPRRADALRFEAPHLVADLSKQRLDAGTLEGLEALAAASDFAGWRAKLFGGEIVNTTEVRPAMHWALRSATAPAEVLETRAQMRAFAADIQAAGEINSIIHLGIGGSDLGPRLIYDALKAHRRPGIEVRFAANVDGADVADVVEGLDPSRTLLIVASKTFTTQETLANAEFVRAWGPKMIAAVTAAPKTAEAWGVAAERVFPFWDWVGGRYSLWSSVGLACEIALEPGTFDALLQGAADMDEHFRTTPFAANLPALLAGVQHWNREALGYGSYALIPYSERLRLLPAFLQQLEMESNGKGVTRDGEPLTSSACGVTWGAAGTNGQHSFFQLLHQGVDIIPVEFIVFEGPGEGPEGNLPKLLANALAQARALMVGKTQDQARSEMMAKGMAAAEADRLAPHRAFQGNRPSTLIALEALSATALGALLALYEHRTFTQGVLAGINPFDQWGVELGKEMANALAPMLTGEVPVEGLDASTSYWVERLGGPLRAI